MRVVFDSCRGRTVSLSSGQPLGGLGQIVVARLLRPPAPAPGAALSRIFPSAATSATHSGRASTGLVSSGVDEDARYLGNDRREEANRVL